MSFYPDSSSIEKRKLLKTIRKRYHRLRENHIRIPPPPPPDRSFRIISNNHSNALTTYPSFPILHFFGTRWAFVLKCFVFSESEPFFEARSWQDVARRHKPWRAAQSCRWSVNFVDRGSGRCCLFSKVYSTPAGDQEFKHNRERRADLAIKLNFSTEEKEINNGVIHLLRYIWKHMSNQDVFEADSVPVHAR